ncbi:MULTISPECIES: multidrug effflux MFS transporter [Burkholderiaceae]|uniref:multidrug effflux MFS transporter n=1 Tax=Burkholderiaceae TaxID=119060 RepID=UPI001423EE17|nr:MULTISPECIES: multidrug effflux MFS transporter [Burkholderiaceae]NIF55151.1 multidrug effflux MFS transporter [Burkholderia sp. Ax-1724]NIF80856.1 multidrug effflux MFS transporter [Paraburkholderia sp. Cy-641]
MNTSCASTQTLVRAPSLFILVCITLSGTFPLHVFVPALPSAARDLHASTAGIGLTITLYIIGLSIGQLIYGPLSDRYGRRPVLLAGLTLFAIASVAAACAPSLKWLELARVLQALGGCSGLVLGRAIARDSSGSTTLIRRLATLSIAMAVATAVAPVIGAQFVAHLGWRWIFITMSATNVLVLVSVWLVVPETHVPSRNFRIGRYLISYTHLLRSPSFLAYSIGGASATTGIYAFLSASPFILESRLGLSPQAFGFAYFSLVVGLASGQSAAKHMAGSFPARSALLIAAAIMAGASLSLIVSYAANSITLVSVMVPMIVMFFATGLSSPYAISSALDVDASVVGAAAGLYGCLQMAYGSLCTAAIGLSPSDPTISMIVALIVSSAIAWFSFKAAPRPVALADAEEVVDQSSIA